MGKEVNLCCMYCGTRLQQSESSMYYDCPKCDFKITEFAVNAIIQHREIVKENQKVLKEDK